MRPPDAERGAALLTVLLLVAVIAALAATSLEKLHLSTRLAGNAGRLSEARGGALAAEVLATTRIDALLGRNPPRITLAGGWSGRPFALPMPGGVATARVRDGGNCFNLNGLVTDAGNGSYAAYQPAQIQFERLMRLVGVPGQVAGGIAAAATDWIDSDGLELPGGAEDGRYAALDPPYRTAGTLMADPSELRAVEGVTPAIYAQLRPWLCALPVARPSTINVDTLVPEQAPLVAMLFPDTLGIPAAAAMIARQPPQGFTDTGEFLRGTAAVPDAAGQLGVRTTWFALDVDVAAGGTTLHEWGTIDATRLPSRLVSRQWGEP